MILENYRLTCTGTLVSLITATGVDYGRQHWKLGHKFTAIALCTPVIGLIIAISLRILSAILYSPCCGKRKIRSRPPIIHPLPIVISNYLPKLFEDRYENFVFQSDEPVLKECRDSIPKNYSSTLVPPLEQDLEEKPTEMESTMISDVIEKTEEIADRYENCEFLTDKADPSPQNEEESLKAFDTATTIHEFVEPILMPSSRTPSPSADTKEANEKQFEVIELPEFSEKEFTAVSEIGLELAKVTQDTFAALNSLKSKVNELEKGLAEEGAKTEASAYEVHELDKKCYDLLFSFTKLLDGYKQNKSTDLGSVLPHYQLLRNQYYGLVDKIQKCKKKWEASGVGNILETPAKVYLRNLHSWEAFCNTYSPEVTLKEAEAFRIHGEALLKKILSGASAEKTVYDRTSLMWALMYRAVKKGQGFEEGAYVIRDPAKRLFDYLVSCEGHYSRASSHPMGNQCNGVNWQSHFIETATQHAINIEGQPARKSTIVFDLIDKGKFGEVPGIYIKPENHATDSLMAMFWHSIEYIKARQNKKVVGADDMPNMRKERIPHAEKKLFEKIAEQCSRCIEEVNKEAEQFLTEKKIEGKELKQSILILKNSQRSRDAAKYGLSFMKQYLDAIKAIANHSEFKTTKFNEMQSDITEFEKMISKYDHMTFRTGREVCFEAEELCVVN